MGGEPTLLGLQMFESKEPEVIPTIPSVLGVSPYRKSSSSSLEP